MLVRVLRLVEFVGEATDVDLQVSRSLSGTACVNGKVQITAVTLVRKYDRLVDCVGDSVSVDRLLNEARQHPAVDWIGEPRLVFEFDPAR